MNTLEKVPFKNTIITACLEAALYAEDAEEVGLCCLELYGEGRLVPVGEVFLQGHHHTGR
jgi:hypothetical protein